MECIGIVRKPGRTALGEPGENSREPETLHLAPSGTGYFDGCPASGTTPAMFSSIYRKKGQAPFRDRPPLAGRMMWVKHRLQFSRKLNHTFFRTAAILTQNITD